MWKFHENYVKNKKNRTKCGKKQNKVKFIEIRTNQNVFIYNNYLSVTLSSKVAFATKSEPHKLLFNYSSKLLFWFDNRKKPYINV